MRSFSKPFKPLLILALVLLLFVGFQETVAAQSTAQLSSRISRLESENSVLRSRLSRLESQVARVGRASGVAIPDQPPIAADSALADDPMFDRLATLVIELRDRIIVLENQVAELAGDA